MGPVRQVHRGRTGGEVKPDKNLLSSVLNEVSLVWKEPEKLRGLQQEEATGGREHTPGLSNPLKVLL